MPTPAQIDEQIALERDAIKQGLSRLHRQTRSVEEKEYASASIYGTAAIDAMIPRVMARIQSTKDRIFRFSNGVLFKEIAQYLADIEADACAVIALKITFDKVFSFRDDANQVINVCDAIGVAVEQECQMRYYEREVPGLLHVLKDRYWHAHKGTQQKFSVIRLMMNRNGVHWNRWSRDLRVKLGGWLLDCIMTESGWFYNFDLRKGKKSNPVILPTAEFMDMRDELMANACQFAAIAMPMLIPPKEWKTDEPGGYLLNEVMHGHDMVRRSVDRIQGETPFEFLNELQSVAYQLNPFVVDVARTLLDRGYKVGKFVPVTELPLPPKPVDIAENREARKEYNRAAAKVMDENSSAFQKSCRTRMTMEMVERFIDKERFYLPWSFDYRGRAYPIPAYLTPHDTDFGKSLIRFADASRVTSSAVDWLAFQVATTYGLDKAPMDERLMWARANHELISRIATDPIGNLSDWEGVSEPWMFLAACEEYYACVITESRTTTCLPVAVDATCSGLQILAGMAKDASTARLVNVLPSDAPQDAYKAVLNEAYDELPKEFRDQMCRKDVKRVVMTVPYNAKPHSNRQYIRDSLKEKGIEHTTEQLTQCVKAVRSAMDRIVPGPMAVMKWIEDEVSIAIDEGATELEWTTPSGFVVVQKLMKQHTKKVTLQLLGCRTLITTGMGDTDQVDKAHHKNATAPNLIHSIDASILHIAVTAFRHPISVIHDSVLGRATDMDELSAVMRQTYMWMFTQHDVLEDWAADIGAQSKPPMINTLEPERVIDSTYFFC